MKLLLSIILTLSFSAFITVTGQNKSTIYEENILSWQENMNSEFKDSKTSPLTTKGLEVFNGLDFYKVNEKFKVEAKFVKTPYEPVFGMTTTTSRLPEYKKYGIATFTIDGKKMKLNIYQNQGLINKKGYEDYLFVPYIDLTSGDTSYSGGKYIDLRIPDGNKIIIDFNKSYNPYCAYNHKYSCPIPPAENTINVRIEAGVKAYSDLKVKSHK